MFKVKQPKQKKGRKRKQILTEIINKRPLISLQT